MKISVLGGGTIGTAVALALRNRGHEVIVTRRSAKGSDVLSDAGIEVHTDNIRAVESADTVIVALKPLDGITVLRNLKSKLEGKLVISMAAALSTSKMRSLIPAAKVVRAMTNIAARVGGGYTVFCHNDLSKDDIRKVTEILSCFGECELVEERHMDALTAMSGSGPAYIFTVIESMVYAGLKVGLPRELALRSSYQTVLGSAKLVAASDSHVSELRDLVTTPGGVTIDALYELEEAGLRTAFMRAIAAATEKARKISDSLEKA